MCGFIRCGTSAVFFHIDFVSIQFSLFTDVSPRTKINSAGNLTRGLLVVVRRRPASLATLYCGREDLVASARLAV